MVSELKKDKSISGDRSHIILTVIQASLLISIAISSDLWFPFNKIFPSVPVFHFFQDLPLLLIVVLSLLFILSLIIAYSRKYKPQLFLFLFCFFYALSSSIDYLRIQPWSYYYFFMILCFAVDYKEPTGTRTLTLIRLMMASIYIWSGIQKLNYSFLFSTYPDLIEPLTNHLPDVLNTVLLKLGIIGPLAELFGGVALFWKRTRLSGIIILTLVHFFILMMLGPLGKAINIIIWPWNISFMILLWMLFNDENSEFSLSMVFKDYRKPFTSTIIILFGVLPALSFFGLWPMYFSSALYSGNKVKSEIYLPDKFSESLPEILKANIDESKNSIVLNNWTQAELSVAMYPDAEIHLEVFRRFCENYPEFENEFALITHSRPNILTGNREETSYFCDELDYNKAAESHDQ